MKNTIELIEKLLIILTLVIGVGVSIYEGLEYLSAKSAVVNARAAQERETVVAQQLLTRTYAQILTHLVEDIRVIDNELMKENYQHTVNWEKLTTIRAEKVKDRNQLLLILAQQLDNSKN